MIEQSARHLLLPSHRRVACYAALALLIQQPILAANIPVAGTCTLDLAIRAANADDDQGGLCPPGGSGPDILDLTADVNLAAAPTSVTTDVTIDGHGYTIARTVAPTFGIFTVSATGTLILDDVTVQNGSSAFAGGAVNNRGILTVTNSTLSSNFAADRGGAIYSRDGTVVVSNSSVTDNDASFGAGIFSNGAPLSVMNNSSVSGNTATTRGGGIYTSGATATTSLTDSTVAGNIAPTSGGIHKNFSNLTITRSTVSGNMATSAIGGGIYAYGPASTLEVTNSTISGNSAATKGGGIWSRVTLVMTNSTVSGNSAVTGGGGIYQDRAQSVTLKNSIVANSPSGGNCAGFPFIDMGANFDDDASCAGAPITPGVDFDIALGNNGGPTQTHALLSPSVAQNAAGACGLVTDQRGELRNDGACDSGAFELGLGACCTDGPGTASDCIVATQDDCERDDGLFLGTGTECFDGIDCSFLFVSMDTMSAEATADGVIVSWTTSAEIETVGFRVLRESGAREKALAVVASLIHAAGNGLEGTSYELLDASPAAARAVHYYIEDIDVFGKVTRHGPIAVDRGERHGTRIRPTTRR